MTLLPLLVSLSVLAADPTPECDPAMPTLCAAPLRLGQPAPYAGQLLSTELALRLGQKADRCDAYVRIEIDYAARMAQVQLDLERQKRRIDLDAALATLAATRRYYQQQLDDSPSPWLVGGLAVAATVAVTVLAVWATSSLVHAVQ